MYTGCPVCGRKFVVHWPELHPFQKGDRYYCSQECKNADDKQFVRRIRTEASLREGEYRKMNRKITREQKEKAVRIAISGRNPLDYLAGLGCKAPGVMWCSLKKDVEKADPELYAKIPDLRTKKPPEAAKEPEEDPLKGFEPYEPGKKLVAPVTGPVIIEPVMKAETMGPESNTEEVLDNAEKALDNAEKVLEKKVKHMPITRPLVFDGLEVCAVSGKYGAYQIEKITEPAILEYCKLPDADLKMTAREWKEFMQELIKAAGTLGIDLRPEEAP